MKKITRHYKKIILVFLFITNTFLSFSQISTDLIKYWFYRNRLKYFVIPGEKIGESQIVCVRNKIQDQPINDKKNVDYGQHGTYTGLYIGVLATEYYLLSENNQDYKETLKELYYALIAYEEKMDNCESKPPWNKEDDEYDGFFMRNNVPENFICKTTTLPI